MGQHTYIAPSLKAKEEEEEEEERVQMIYDILKNKKHQTNKRLMKRN